MPIAFFLLLLLLRPFTAPAGPLMAGQPDSRGSAPIARKSGTLTGRMLLKSGEPLAGGKVNLFRHGAGPAPARNRYWRTPDVAAVINDDGQFTVSLTEGRYYLSAVRKQTRNMIGPPGLGDFVYPDKRIDPGNELPSFQVVSGQTTNIGTIAEAVPFRKDSAAEEVITSMAGRITDREGKPVAGAIVLAFPSKNVIGKPLYVSERTKTDGTYVLKVGDGGDYYLKATTSVTEGRPVLGVNSGVYGAGEPEPVTVKLYQKRIGIDVVIRPLQSREMKKGKSDPFRAMASNLPPTAGGQPIPAGKGGPD